MKIKCPNCAYVWEVSFDEFHKIQTKKSNIGIISCPHCKEKMDLQQHIVNSKNHSGEIYAKK
ncbi:MAG: hypothetical protein KAW88_04100 [Candidatus Cloacimonetes bacterium]|nr:hypothetical protein [Candidatus Cloacimonadota bacterium]